MNVVFDCNVYLQAMMSNGPARRCFEAAGNRIILWASEAILAELASVLLRREFRQKFPAVTDRAVEAFLEEIRRVARVAIVVPKVFPLPRDPDDQKYLDLAIAANAVFVVTRDSDLTDLMTATDLHSQLFRAAFPDIEILRPEPFLARLDVSPSHGPTP